MLGTPATLRDRHRHIKMVQVIAFLAMEGLQPAPLETDAAHVAFASQQLAFATTLSRAAAATQLSHFQAVPHDVGRLLMDFLQLFGCDFDAAQQGISVRQGGLVSREAAGGKPGQPGLVVEDPQVCAALESHQKHQHAELTSFKCSSSAHLGRPASCHL